jgi:hypothetical protein
MRRRNRCKLAVEMLEQRDCPSVTATLSNSNSGNLVNLVVTADSATSNLQIVETSQGSFTVSEASLGQPLSFTGVTGSVVLQLSNSDDTGVLVNLDGNSIANLIARLGGGNNDLTVENGTINGVMYIGSGRGTDSVTLGDGTTALTVKDHTAINLGAGGADSLQLLNMVDLKADLTAVSANTLTMDAGSTVEGNAIIRGGAQANNVNLQGTIDGDAFFFGHMGGDTLSVGGSIGKSLFAHIRGNTTVITAGSIGTDAIIWGPSHDMEDRSDPDDGHGSDVMNLGGTIGHNLIALAGTGGDTISISATVGNNALILTGSGADSISFTGSVGSDLRMLTGLGGDTINLGGHVGGVAAIRTGNGQDNINVTGTVGTNLFIVSGNGADTINLGGNIGQVALIRTGNSGDVIGVTATVGKDLVLFSGNGTDSISLGGTITNNAFVFTGNGGDAVDVSGSVGHSLYVITGNGTDTVIFEATAVVGQDAIVNLGNGPDTLKFMSGATITGQGRFWGGNGSDTFWTDLAAVPSNVTLMSFEDILLNQ